MTEHSGPQYFGKDLEAMSFAHNYHRWIVSEFRPYLGRTVAEIGAGMGNLSQLLLETGIDKLCAFEPSANMYPLLEEKFRDTERIVTFNGYFEETGRQYRDFFDSVVYVNVLEHIEDDRNALLFARTTLRNDGYLLIFVPALSWLFSDFDRAVGHFRRYHKRPLSDLVKTAGFRVEALKYFDIGGIIPWYVAFVLLKRGLTKGNASLYDRWVVPPMRIAERLVTPPIGKNLLLVARKPAR